MRIGPLIALACISLMGLGISVAKHGEPKEGKEDAGLMFVAIIIKWGLILWAIL